MTAALLGLAIGFIGSMPFAGPIALMVLRKGMRHQYSEGAALALGASVSEAGYCLLAVMGMDWLFVRYPMMAPASRLIGALMMLALGMAFIFTKQGEEVPDEQPRRSRKAAPFFMGFSISALNPVLILTWSGVTAVIYSLRGPFGPWEKLLFPTAAGVGMFLWFVVLLWLMRKLHSRFNLSRIGLAVRGFGLMMALFGLYLLFGAMAELSARW